MIFDDIRNLRKLIDNLILKIDRFVALGSVSYSEDRVQTSPSNSFEDTLIGLIEDQNELKQLEKEYDSKRASLNLDGYTHQQKRFIELYYFQALSMCDCCIMMDMGLSDLCELKKSISC